MRNHSRCTKCNGTKLFVCESRQPDGDYAIFPLVLTTVPIAKQETGAARGTGHRSEIGSYETWICAACGYTEWYARDPEQLMGRLAVTPGSGVRLVGG